MDHIQTLNWQEFKETLLQNQDLDLQFQYDENSWVDQSYHITEIKQAPITSVDCGGKLNSWTEIIVQLWEPGTKQQGRAMKVRKALTIVDLVEKALALDPSATVKIEFGNSGFDTRQMFPGEITVEGDNLVVDLRADTVQCKAIERGGSCGTTTTGEGCCAPAAEEKPMIKLNNLAAAAVCTPGSGCC
jgi:hypothetical protein